jgi:BolA family transcriptional regulator, general stress-responsive regulator
MSVQQRIEQHLTDTLQPAWLRVVNESFMHKAPPGAESHFKVLIVSPAFEEKPLVERHRMVYTSLGDDILDKVHALTIVSRTPAEWNTDATILESPACSNGSKSTT